MSSAAIHQVGGFDTTELKGRDLLELFVAYTLIQYTQSNNACSGSAMLQPP
jgi:hypothetical protein